MNVLSSVDTKKAEAAEIVDELWYKDAIIYQLHVKSFFDSNNDGIGDFAGLTREARLISRTSASPRSGCCRSIPRRCRDDGYDIADYGASIPTTARWRTSSASSQEAHERGLARHHRARHQPHLGPAPVVPARARSHRRARARATSMSGATPTRNTTARASSSSTPRSPTGPGIPRPGAYYWHRFFSHQPDLNFDNPRVSAPIIQVMRYWLDLGVDGLRLDAIPYLVEREGTNNENLPETHAVLEATAPELDAITPDRMLLAEANQWPEDVQEYFGDGDECHMAFHFPLMPRIYMAIAQEDRFPITDIMRQTPDIPAQLPVGDLPAQPRRADAGDGHRRRARLSVVRPTPTIRRARINLGIRRRLAPLMENDRRKIELMNSLLLSMPGTPIIYYGDEIGMGDNIYLGDRNGVRTPMQWSPDRNGGFSRADPARLYAAADHGPALRLRGGQRRGAVAQPVLAAQLDQAADLRCASRRCAFGRGTMTFIRPANRTVLAYVRQYDDEVILCVANLSRSAQAIELDLSAVEGPHPAGDARPHALPARSASCPI